MAAVALGAPERRVSFSVPTGNFGDILAGYYAKRMGLPIDRLVIATNENDILARALASGVYKPLGVKATQSPSMDIQVSSNFERLLFEAYDRDADAVRALMGGLAQSRRIRHRAGTLERIRADFAADRVDEAACAAEIGALSRERPRRRSAHRGRRRRGAQRAGARSRATPVIALAPPIPPSSPTRSSAPPAGVPPCRRISRHRPRRSDQRPAERRGGGRAIRSRTRAGGGLSVRVTTLPSGLRVVTDATPHLRTAAVGVFVGAGSRHESVGEHGLSHLLEHMAFKGTRKRSARDIAEAIENVGGDLNAETGVERTGYFARVLGDDVGLALDVLGDILTDSQFDPEELGARRTSSCRRSARSRTRPTISCSISSPPLLGRIRRSAGRSSARARASAHSTATRSTRISVATIAPGGVVAAAGAVEHGELSRAPKRFSAAWAPNAEPPAPADYRGGEILVKKTLEQTHVVVAFEGRAIRRPTTTPRMSSPRRRAGACPRACSRRCARSAASPIRYMLFTGITRTPACSASMPARRTRTRAR